MKNFYMEMQSKIERLLESFFPECRFPYFDRRDLTSRIMLIAYEFAIEVNKEIANNFYKSISTPVVIQAENMSNDREKD